jgi:hypothetical protein
MKGAAVNNASIAAPKSCCARVRRISSIAFPRHTSRSPVSLDNIENVFLAQPEPYPAKPLGSSGI